MPQPSPYVSRAGEKLAYALDVFGVDPAGMTCADLGAHVGGFTDCLLQWGASRVYAVDTGHNVLHYRLRGDPRVVVMERTNALHAKIPELVDLVTIDVGWTTQRLIIPKALKLIRPGGRIISLLKPHYEALPRERMRGTVRGEYVDVVVRRSLQQLEEAGGRVLQMVESPLSGSKGKNREFFLLVRPADRAPAPDSPSDES